MYTIIRKSIVWLLVGLQLAWPVMAKAATAPAVPVSLDDQPINTTSMIKPNVMFTLDNSGSMDATYAPEETGGNWSKYCYYDYRYNRLYYNPNYTYLPPVLGDGSRMPNSSYTAAWEDGFHTGDGTVNLQNKYSQLGTYPTYMGNMGTQNRGAYYATYSGTGTYTAGACNANSVYTIVDMNAASATEKQNFANWFSYYRTRLLAMKSAAGEAFRAIGEEFRVGFHTIDGQTRNDSYGGFVPVGTFSGQQRTDWYTMFYRQYAWYGTPLRPAMQRIGEYYRAGTSPAGGSVADPVQYACQPNYHILSTDGYWNGAGASGTLGSTNWNNTLPNNTALLTALGSEFNQVFAAGQAWPAPYREKAGSNSTNTLADIAAYYWQTDLRPTMADSVPVNSKDSASWQHVTQFTLAFSAQGSVPFPNGINAIKAGTSEWPSLGSGQTYVDDLWAAAIVGHGQYFNVSSPSDLLNMLSAALTDISGRMTSGTASVGNSADYEYSNAPYLFRANYIPGEWTGKLEARSLNAYTGAVTGAALWDVRTKLDAQVVGSGWDTKRMIATRNTSTGNAVPFRWASLSAAQQASLDSDTTTAQRILQFLRGDQAYEDNAPATAIPAPTSSTGIFRDRNSVLGSIINSRPAYLAAPNSGLLESYNPGYTAFQTNKANRTPMLYFGASDGMLHAVKATVGDADSGEEKWAYIPSMLFRDGVDGLASWAWKYSDPLPKKFSHRYRVDQSPTVADVDFGKAGNPSGSTNWGTLLVAGLNKGGKGYFALDVTDPEAANEAAVAGKVLWEFTGDSANDAKMGYTFGEPMVFKTRRFGWVVGVTSGYNNAAGTGHLWLLNPKTGAILHRFDTGAGTAASPSGLGQINYFRQSERDNTAEQIYAGDLQGNLWRFDVSSAAAGDWTTSAVKLASIGEPITTAPVPTLNPFNPKERWVVFGSGKLLSQDDVSNIGTGSTMFAIKDGSGTTPSTPSPALAKSDLVALTVTSAAPQGDSVKGWYIPMATAGYGQINFMPQVRRGIVMWGANKPTADLCTNGMAGYLFARALGTGSNMISTGTSLPVPGGFTGVDTVKVKRASNSVTSSQAAVTLKIDRGDGETDSNSSVSFKTPLYGGRSNLRYVQVQ